MLAGTNRATRRRLQRRHFFLYEHHVAAAFDAPTGNRIQRRRAQRFARFETEARMMQRTSNRLANDQALGESPAIVRAVGADGEESIAGTRQQHVILADASGQHVAARQRFDGYPERQIGGLHDGSSFELLSIPAAGRCRRRSKSAPCNVGGNSRGGPADPSAPSACRQDRASLFP